MSSELAPIPHVPTHFYGLLGNLPDVDGVDFAPSLWKLADLYGPIFQLDLGGTKVVVLSNYELAAEVLKDDKYEKAASPGQLQLRPFLKDGLFTAFSHEENWYRAHRILMPVFGPMAVKKMFDKQLDIAGQMVLKWDRMSEYQDIDVVDDTIRLAFDALGICAFSYRFNNFYTMEMHPFAVQMAETLVEAGKRATRTSLETSLRYFSQKKMNQDIDSMHKLCQDIIDDRYKNPQPDNNDLVNVMLNVKDPDTGEKLSKENVMYQMVTFLVAGHETTAGTLAFMFYNLTQNPDAYHTAQKEVDDVIGNDVLTVDHIPKLKYIDACIKETLRFQGPITLLSRHAKEPVTLAEKYAVTPDMDILVNIRDLQRDSKVWGDDAKEFKPERWLEPEVPIHGWKPFGTGVRSCIGRYFTEQEMIMTTALVLQRFQITMADPSYNLKLKSTMTIKPTGFYLKVQRRPGKHITTGLGQPPKDEHKEHHEKTNGTEKKLMTILYGSNAGTCKTFAEELASDADEHGFSANVKTMDSASEHLPANHPVIIITPSYEGKPADNAKRFCSWLETNSESKDMLKGVSHAVFGVGNSEWVNTYHKVPKTVHHLMKGMGAVSVLEPGFVDVKMDAVGPWEEWRDKLWSTLSGKASTSSIGPSIQATISKADTSSILGGFETTLVTVKENIALTSGKSGPVKMHMEVELPEGMTYNSGDYLAVLPSNHRDNVLRVIRRFPVHADDLIQVTETRKDFLKTSHPTSIFDLLSTRVELGTPITPRQVERLIEVTGDEEEKKTLAARSKDFEKEFLQKRVTILDVLEEYPSCKIDLVHYLDMLQALTPRQYSISSSPLADTNYTSSKMTASISYDVLEQTALSGHDRTFYGACSTMLARMKPGSLLHATVRATNASFHLPTDPSTPVIMIAAGTGIAPMRGFIQERAAIKAARGDILGPALLYFGCRDAEDDYIYHHELEHWEKQGVVSLRTCFSRKTPNGSDNFKYTSDRMMAEKDEIADLFVKGAKIFVCGSASKVGKSTGDACKKIWLEKHPDKTEEQAAEWLDQIREDRYVSDVFG